MRTVARCVQCALVLDARAWRGLELVECIEHAQLAEAVTTWPSDTVVEVRRCTCGHVMARKSEPAQALG